MQESSKVVAARIINTKRPASLLDAPCGSGWLLERITYRVEADGIDLFDAPGHKYRTFLTHDLDNGLPPDLPVYESIVCCEGIEHFGNPGLFLTSAWEHLDDKGFLMITTPNVWYPASKLQFLARGFFPGFPSLAGKIRRGTHMHIMPWSYPQLYLFLKLYGFTNITIHSEPLNRPKHFMERLVALPQKLYCKNKLRKSSGSERAFWKDAVSSASIHGRHLIITADKDPSFRPPGELAEPG